MTLADRLIEMPMTVVLIIGGYQFYFYCQRRRWFQGRLLETRFDGMIGYDPRWVWVYSGLYYPMILLAALSIPTWEAYGHVVGCYMALLAVQCAFFLFMPVEIPPEWRTIWRGPWEGTRSQRFLDLVWRFDKLRNSLPSMHVSVAVMTDLVIWRYWPAIGHIGIAFPVLIAISALKTKQHYVVDVLPGAVCGAAVFFAWVAVVPSAGP